MPCRFACWRGVRNESHLLEEHEPAAARYNGGNVPHPTRNAEGRRNWLYSHGASYVDVCAQDRSQGMSSDPFFVESVSVRILGLPARSKRQTMPDERQDSSTLHDDDVSAIDELRSVYEQLRKELGRIIVGQQAVIEKLAICLFAGGHALLMGVPGLAKTLLVSRLAETMALGFSRIQFTPDLMPMDITGTDILQETPGQQREFEFVKGPVFANIVLADEINRAPSKTQAAMLEAMQEHKVTVVGRPYHLAPPFFVLATQNPIEQEGTYPLPEAQLDRFMFLIEVDYPDRGEEIEIARTTTGTALADVAARCWTAQQVIEFQDLVRRVPVPEHIYEFAVDLTRHTRPKSDESPRGSSRLSPGGRGRAPCSI